MVEDSQAHWLALRDSLDDFDIRLGKATAQAYVHDPRMISFIAARYKFVAKMLAGVDTALEVGCGDAFGAPIVAQAVKRLICTDIDADTVMKNQPIAKLFPNIEFIYKDFRTATDEVFTFPAIYSVDVIEHLFPHEEAAWMANMVAHLQPDGIMLTGTPNKTAAAYASPNSVHGHVNLKSHDELRDLMRVHFKNVFMFGMNDEVVHTGFAPMANYLWALGVGRR